jgi:hypothetical protein
LTFGSPVQEHIVKRLFSRLPAVLTAVIISAFLLSSGCSATNSEGFAIYLTRGDIPPSQLSALSHVEIAGQPVIAMNDIVTYNSETHEISITADAVDRISSLEVPVSGKSFVVCVDRKVIYCGAFWTPISSLAFEGITIWKPLISQESKVIKLELGYPSSSFYGGEDPRNDEEVMESLERAGKLITTP